MLKVVIFDSGYGGEFFADRLQEELPVVDIVRVIDWRHADNILGNAKDARKTALASLRPYIGKADLIIFANHLLTITSLKYFRRRFKNQRFVGLKLKFPDSPSRKEVIILTTRAVTKTISYYNYLFHLRRKSKTLTLDHWPAKIDDGELTENDIRETLGSFIDDRKGTKEIVLACSQFYDIKPELRKIYGHNLKIYDGFDDTIREIAKILKIRGGTKKRK